MEKSFLSEEITQNNVENKPQVGDVSLGLGALYCVVSSDKKLFPCCLSTLVLMSTSELLQNPNRG